MPITQTIAMRASSYPKRRGFMACMCTTQDVSPLYSHPVSIDATEYAQSCYQSGLGAALTTRDARLEAGNP